MIDTRELRPGNYITVGDRNQPVKVTLRGIYEGIALDSNGILLADDVLLKCGFRIITRKIIVDVGELEMTFSKAYQHLHRQNIFLFINGKHGFMLTKHVEGNIYCPLGTYCFLHELQNIYYWLSGKKELEVRL